MSPGAGQQASPAETRRRLATGAVLGTDRTGAMPQVSLPERVADAARGLEGPAWMLAAAAGLGQYIAGGVRPVAIDAAVMPAAEAGDDRPASAAISRLLARVLHEDARLVPECLDALAERGLAAPYRTLPALLELAAKNRVVREKLPPVLGCRGRWLASLNPDWASARGAAPRRSLPDDAENRWETSGRAERVELLRAARRDDPARARALIERTWVEDGPADRAAFIGALRDGLGPDDEPLLERALDGRQSERSAAAELLSMLPGSALSARMLGRAESVLTIGVVSKGVVRRRPKASLDASPPEEPDRDMKRDGVQSRQSAGLGKRAATLRSIIGLTPLGGLETRYGISPVTLIEAARASDWWAALREGWTLAIVRQRDVRWAAALIEALDAEELLASERRGVLALVGRESPESIAGLLERSVSSDAGSMGMLARVVSAIPGPWNARVSEAVLACLEPQFRRKAPGHASHTVAECLDAAACRIHTTYLPELASIATAAAHGDGQWVRQRTAVTLDLRAAFHEELSRV